MCRAFGEGIGCRRHEYGLEEGGGGERGGGRGKGGGRGRWEERDVSERFVGRVNMSSVV